jgi:uncharacterized membrane protein YeiH
MPDTLQLLTLAGTLAFAVSGALQAARHRMDIVGFIFVASITGVGGGTLRDLLLDTPVFWLGEWYYVAACTVGAVVTYFSTSLISKASRALLWADAAGMALFSVLGAQKALALGMSIPVATIMGMFSACLGSILRDVILNEVPIVLHREIYVTASLAGTLSYALAAEIVGLSAAASVFAGCIVAFTVRALAISRKLSLPAFGATDS